MQYICDWQGSKSRRWWWNAGTLCSTLIWAKNHGGDIKRADQHKKITQIHTIAQAKIS